MSEQEPSPSRPVPGPPPNMPQPSSHLLPADKIAAKFGIETEPAFTKYMGLHKVSRIEYLLDLRDAMAESAHPIVRYAAGWAATEAAMFRHGYDAKGRPPLERRLDALESAKGLWLGAYEGMGDLERSMKTPSGKEDVMALGVRLLHSVCYLPNMGIAASFITNQPFEPMEIHQRRQQSRQQAADLAKSVLQLPLAGRMRRQYVAGLAAEVAGGLLGQIDDVGDNPLRYIVMPSPFRHDNHPEAHLRGDLVANATFAPFRKTLMQITSFEREKRRPEAGYDKRRLIFNVRRDLTIGREFTIYDTLNGLIAFERGKASPTTEASLRVLARIMTMRLDEFQVRHDRNSAQGGRARHSPPKPRN